ncbi:methyltransferase family protein, partial [Elusimicrobiota bacterium]
METTLYCIALVTIIVFPAGVSMWFVIHPFIDTWRRLGPITTYTVVIANSSFIAMLVYYFRADLLSIHFEFSMLLGVLSGVLILLALILRILLEKYLKPSIMLGLPEITPDDQVKLITQGIYSFIRHPRYLEVGFALAAIALFVNYLAIYILFLVYIPVIYIVVLMEEKELRQRFGKDYEEYCKRVPRFLPKILR